MIFPNQEKLTNLQHNAHEMVKFLIETRFFELKLEFFFSKLGGDKPHIE